MFFSLTQGGGTAVTGFSDPLIHGGVVLGDSNPLLLSPDLLQKIDFQKTAIKYLKSKPPTQQTIMDFVTTIILLLILCVSLNLSAMATLTTFLSDFGEIIATVMYLFDICGDWVDISTGSFAACCAATALHSGSLAAGKFCL